MVQILQPMATFLFLEVAEPRLRLVVKQRNSSSGGKVVWHEGLKRAILKGWHAGTLSALGEIISGATPSTAIPANYVETGIAWITPNDLSDSDEKMHIGHGERDISEQGLKACSAQLMPPGSVIMSSRAPIGYLAVATENCCTNQGCKSLMPKNGYGSYFVFLTMKRRMPVIKAQGVGTTFTEVSKETLASIPLELPPSSIAARFEDLVFPLCNQIRLLEQESKELSSLRSWLLPMLMNGQAAIGD
ncbi:restriction endonuclease subunit S [Eggerthellaceae bacterium zg-893]|nr:restriction endonuclease subunit S [Eggerthellaceae bacterium zg-893]